MKTAKTRETPNYAAMAETLLQIAQELRMQAAQSHNTHDLAQAERLERIVAEIRAGGTNDEMRQDLAT